MRMQAKKLKSIPVGVKLKPDGGKLDYFYNFQPTDDIQSLGYNFPGLCGL